MSFSFECNHGLYENCPWCRVEVLEAEVLEWREAAQAYLSGQGQGKVPWEMKALRDNLAALLEAKK